MEAPLLSKTYGLLDASPLTIREIADGAGVGYHWLGKFKQRKYSDPGVNAVESFYTFLATQTVAA